MNKAKKVFVVMCLALFIISCGQVTASSPSLTATHVSPSPLPTLVVGYPFGVRTKTRNCVFNMIFPDRACTPGSIFTNATAAIVCVPGYTARVRDRSTKTKQAIDKAYGYKYDPKQPTMVEVDHMIPLELGGSNDYANLWVENSVPVPGYHEKDEVENALHREVCIGKMSLEQAQHDLATDWVAVYNSLPAACKKPYPAKGCVYTTDSVDNGQ